MLDMGEMYRCEDLWDFDKGEIIVDRWLDWTLKGCSLTTVGKWSEKDQTNGDRVLMWCSGQCAAGKLPKDCWGPGTPFHDNVTPQWQRAFQQGNMPCHPAHTVWECFEEYDDEFKLSWPPMFPRFQSSQPPVGCARKAIYLSLHH